MIPGFALWATPWQARLPDSAAPWQGWADRRRAAESPEETSPLLGIPLAIKDVISTQGTPTTCGSRILEGYVPPFDATVIEKLRSAATRLAAQGP